MKLVHREDGSVLELADGKVFGRAAQADLHIDDASISRKHARVERREGRWFLVDLGSSNGCRRNGERSKEFELRPGDLVTLGAIAFEVEGERAPAPPASTPAAAADAAPSPADSGAATQPGGGRREHDESDRERARIRAELRAKPRSRGLGDLGQQSFVMQVLMAVLALAFLAGVIWLVLRVGQGLER